MTKSEAIETTARMLVKSRDPVSVLTAHGQLEDALNLPPDPQPAVTGVNSDLRTMAEQWLDDKVAFRHWWSVWGTGGSSDCQPKSAAANTLAKAILKDTNPQPAPTTPAELERLAIELEGSVGIEIHESDAQSWAKLIRSYLPTTPAELEVVAKELEKLHEGKPAKHWYDAWNASVRLNDSHREIWNNQRRLLESRLAKQKAVMENMAQVLDEFASRLETAAKETP